MEKDKKNSALLIAFLMEHGMQQQTEWAGLIIETLCRLLGNTLREIHEKEKTKDGFSHNDVATALRNSINEIADCFNTAFNEVEREDGR